MTPDVPPSVPPDAVPPAAAQPVLSADEADKKDIEENKDIAAFSYLWIMSVIVYFARAKRSPFIAYHSRQATAIFILSLLFLFVPIINRLLLLCILGLMVYGFVQAVQGKRKSIPILGPLSRKEIGLGEAFHQVTEIFTGLLAKLRPFIKKPVTKTETPPPSPPTPPQP